MHATFRITDPRLVLEAKPGDLFAPLGPELVECVCAIASCKTDAGVEPELPAKDRLNPSALVPVVVVACRAEPGDPEYFPPGFEAELPGASPIVFLAPIQPVMFRPREARGLSDHALARIRDDLLAPHGLHVVVSMGGNRADTIAADTIKRAAVGTADLTRPELASKF